MPKPKKRLAVGDVYKVRGYGLGFDGQELEFKFEIVGELHFEGRRYVVGAKQWRLPDENGIVIFDSDGYGETFGGDFQWHAWETSRAKPCFQIGD
jgi:hypothetical protein